MRNLMAWWLAMHRRGAVMGRRRARQAARAMMAAQQARADARLLAQLDARTLRDIGLEAWRSPLGARIELFRAESQRWTAARMGMV